MMSKKLSLVIVGMSCFALVACEEVEPLSKYTPIVDPAKVSQSKLNSDLDACRAIALKVEADYKERQKRQMMQNMVAGLIAGAITGAVVGSGTHHQGDYIAAGAGAGAAAGAGSSDYTYDLIKYGPRRVVDRCMNDRGYTILNDIGRG